MKESDLKSAIQAVQKIGGAERLSAGSVLLREIDALRGRLEEISQMIAAAKDGLPIDVCLVDYEIKATVPASLIGEYAEAEKARIEEAIAYAQARLYSL